MVRILIEGVDRAGKSTIAQALRRKLKECGRNTTYIHNEAPPRTNDARYARALMEQIYAQQYQIAPTGPCDVIIDRGIISDMVYGETLRQQLPNDLLYLVRIYREDTLVVHVWGDVTELVADDDGESTWSCDDDKEAADQIRYEHGLFVTYAETFPAHIHINPRRSGVDNAVKQILRAIHVWGDQ